MTMMVTMVANAAYSTSTALWPYLGAASLTAIEVPKDSPWKITGYSAAHGDVIQYSDFNDNEKGESLILTVFSGFALQGIPHSNKFRLAL